MDFTSATTVAAVAALVATATALNNGVGRTPAMGYNTWNDFRCNGITAANVMKVTDKMVAMNMSAYGYEVGCGCHAPISWSRRVDAMTL